MKKAQSSDYRRNYGSWRLTIHHHIGSTSYSVNEDEAITISSEAAAA
ncbi:hypothetical protein OK016_22110 [Vibrio chagasii]|nr:hypothetical protein [Vibrio chagasii]